MKVAILITGQLRDYKVNWRNHMKHLIEPNNADVFVYACTKNTLHSCGVSLDQKYYLTNEFSEEEIMENVKKIYGAHLKSVVVDKNEKLPDDNFGTLGYFRTRMQNQIDNIGKGFDMAKKYAKENNFEYDVIIRCRPDNSVYLRPVDVSRAEFKENLIYSTVFTPSGHRDLCFFAMSDPKTFEKYCSYEYLKDEDASRTDSDFKCTEHAWEDYLVSIGVQVGYVPDICRPFTGFDKTRPISDFPYRNKDEKLIDADGNLVDQVLP